MAFRKDLILISSWIKPDSKVLDLGCGDGELLKILKQEKNINGTVRRVVNPARINMLSHPCEGITAAAI